MSDETRHMIIGLQGSGKTTYAAALWYILANGGVTTVLKRGRHAGDYGYLDKIAGLWERGFKVPRTEHFEHQAMMINLLDPASSRPITLQLVDLPGEGFERAFASGKVSNAIIDALEAIDGLLVFVSALHGHDNLSIIDFASGSAEDDEDLDDDDDEEALLEDAVDEQDGGAEVESVPGQSEGQEGASEFKEIPFNPGLTPRDTQIVDLLQRFQDRPVNARFPRISVVISAWDKVSRAPSPEAWLSSRMPLLDQYLKNSGIPTRIYGVSAQGGDVPKDTKAANQLDRKKLLSVPNAGKRIEVVGYDAEMHDLTHPIRWLSGLEGE